MGRLLRAELVIDTGATPKDTYFDYDCSPSAVNGSMGPFLSTASISEGITRQVLKRPSISPDHCSRGVNEIVVMELYSGADVVKFTDTAYYGPHLDETSTSENPMTTDSTSMMTTSTSMMTTSKANARTISSRYLLML